MKIRNVVLATAALSLAASPAIATAFERSSAPVDGENEIAGASGVLIAVLAAAAVIGGIVIIADNDDDEPTSP